MRYYYYMQEMFSFKKRHTSQLYYDGLLLSNMCYYCYKHCYKAILTRSLSYFGRGRGGVTCAHMSTHAHTRRTLCFFFNYFWPELSAPRIIFFFFYRSSAPVCIGETPMGSPYAHMSTPTGCSYRTPTGSGYARLHNPFGVVYRTP